MSAVQFHCPLCDGLFQVDDALSGIEVNCPHCQGLVTVPDFAGPTAPPLPPSEAMQLSCPVCAGLFQVTAELSGQEVHCPHCEQVVTVPDLGGAFSPGYSEPPPSYPLSYPPEPMEPPQKTSAGAIDESHMYPPGFGPAKAKQEQERPREPSAPRRSEPASDPLLPPVTGGAAMRPRDASDLLPPGAASATGATIERKPLPTSIPARSKDVVLIPTEKGYVGVQEPVKTITHRGEEVELRKLTHEEKARRRVVRNTILFAFCIITLIVVMALFMWK
jgi:phage FluMu protein Com